jgi:DNA mismatch repair protein MutS
MVFDIDKQTYSDLELLETQYGEKSVFFFFNNTSTKGGRKCVEKFFSNPLSNLEKIKERVETIGYFQNVSPHIALTNEKFDFIEIYLLQQNIPNRFSITKSYYRDLKYRYSPDNEYYLIKKGVEYSIILLNELYEYSIDDSLQYSCPFILRFKQCIRERIEKSNLAKVLSFKKPKNLYPHTIGLFDYFFRKAERTHFNELLNAFYELDAYKSIAYSAEKYGFTLPDFTDDLNSIEIEGLFHPFIQKPIKNDFNVSNKRVCILTGPNMAGKSTFLKSLSISIYLSHLGFPVPASKMKTSFFNGLLTTINLSDNLNKGYSHFYSEVLRVKHIANRINASENIFVVFDELFRGTNVKDAFEASFSVINSLSKINKGIYFISTHIIEAAEKLVDNPNIKFIYFDANMNNDTPNYTFKVKEGITDERLGLYILNKEKVIEIIEKTL